MSSNGVVEMNRENFGMLSLMKDKIIVKVESYNSKELNDIIIFYLTDNFTKDSEKISYYVNTIISYYNKKFHFETFKSIQNFKYKHNLDNCELNDIVMDGETTESYVSQEVCSDDKTKVQTEEETFDELSILENMKNIQISDDENECHVILNETIKRYNRYISKINDWRHLGYIKEGIEMFLSLQNNSASLLKDKLALMKKLDNDLHDKISVLLAEVQFKEQIEEPADEVSIKQEYIEEVPIKQEFIEEPMKENNIEHANMNTESLFKKTKKVRKQSDNDSEKKPKKPRKTKSEQSTASEGEREPVKKTKKVLSTVSESEGESDPVKKTKKVEKKEEIKCCGLYKNGNKCNNKAKHDGLCGVHGKVNK
jgi:hypothetical protein